MLPHGIGATSRVVLGGLQSMNVEIRSNRRNSHQRQLQKRALPRLRPKRWQRTEMELTCPGIVAVSTADGALGRCSWGIAPPIIAMWARCDW
jgi:hypothetical protein